MKCKMVIRCHTNFLAEHYNHLMQLKANHFLVAEKKALIFKLKTALNPRFLSVFMFGI